jgi:hypothetical protein
MELPNRFDDSYGIFRKVPYLLISDIDTVGLNAVARQVGMESELSKPKSPAHQLAQRSSTAALHQPDQPCAR